ncbi:hypothetical protein [Nocardia asiatica]
MTDTNESIRYALRLPNGKLAHDLTYDERHGGASEELPGGEYAYLWTDEKLAADTLDNVRAAVKRFGLSEMFTQHAEVVQVRLSYQILDGNEPAPLPEYHSLPDGAEKRIRSLISLLEEAHQRDPDGPVNVPALIRQLRAAVDDPPIVEAEVEGVTEPRTWKSAADVPEDVRIRAIGWPAASPTFVRNGSRWTPVDRSRVSEIESDALLDAVWSPTGTGFVEVLS